MTVANVSSLSSSSVLSVNRCWRVFSQKFVRASTQALVPTALFPAMTIMCLFLFQGFVILAIRPALSEV